MPDKPAVELPYYIKLAFIALLVFLLFYLIYLGQSILLPLGFAFLFSILLRPIEKFLTDKGMPKVLAILCCLLVFVLVIFLLGSFISNQVTALADDFPKIKKSLNGLWHDSQVWLNEKLNIPYVKQDKMAEEAKDQAVNTMAPATLNILTVMLVLLPVYIFMFLLYRSLLMNFIVEIFERIHAPKVREILGEIRSVVQHFITGVLFETTLVAILNVTGLLIIGAPYAILLGVLGAIMNTIPYIGGIVQLILSGLIVYSSNSSVSEMLWAMGILLGVQGIDNYVLMPRIVGSRVNLNGLVSITGVLAGGAIAGVGGMFLSIPFLAITKTIFDRVEPLQPYGRVMGGNIENGEKKKRVARKKT